MSASVAEARTMTAGEKRAVEAVVRDHLKDPRSAIFKHPEFRMPDDSGGAIYCGLVNSKNSYGGYAGYAIFQVGFFTKNRAKRPVTVAEFITMGDGDPESEASQVAAMSCSKVPHLSMSE